MLGFTGLQEFLARGGPVLLVIMLATFVMWALIIERLFYFRLAHQAVADEALSEWRSRSDRKSKPAHWVKDKIVSEVRQKAEANVSFTKAMVALAPLLGLLGTVTGMVTVFDNMAITDGADAKALSRGVSQATIPTMAGMVASISGILFTSGMDRRVSRLVQSLEDKMGAD
ncbi:MAG: MotA/TolQ/ExbB proton channel family protein [Henriciella sp.]|jgi:biopolymer transport protein ExbB|nr:MotA/TolQ/ExbB proton channel family protein [Henriciella sp.]|mmetsp:Transcript_2239/g.3385  ORF Transcript_2239/g.3385 Transcript_2239/m.3385 type:complete len:171 (-) Transcript_2239:1514-2026(-)